MINNLILAAYISISPIHDFHITHTTLNYNKHSESIEITVKVAIEDLERPLEDKYYKKLKLGTTEENEAANEIIKEYFSCNLKVSINDIPYEYEWVGKEISSNLHYIYLYFEIPNIYQSEYKEYLKIENTIFLESDLPQTNIVLIEFEDHNYNLTFTRDYISEKIFFNK